MNCKVINSMGHSARHQKSAIEKRVATADQMLAEVAMFTRVWYGDGDTWDRIRASMWRAHESTLRLVKTRKGA